jgi:hypothetical protein
MRIRFEFMFCIGVATSILAVCSVSAQTGRAPARGDDLEGWVAFSKERSAGIEGADRARVEAFLENPHGEDAARSAIKNNLLDRLLAQPSHRPEVGGLLLKLYRDRTLSVMTRDYVLQHFAPYIRAVTASGHSKLDDDSMAIIDELRGAVWSGEGMLSGSALIGLDALAGLDVGVTEEETGMMAMYLAADERCDPAIRATALQVAMQCGRSEVLPLAGKLLQVNFPLPLRMSAVACVAVLGGKSGQAVLSKLSTDDPSDEIRRLAMRAVKRGETTSAARPESGTVEKPQMLENSKNGPIGNNL